MEGYKTKTAQRGTALKPAARGIYEMGNSGAWKTWHVSPHTVTKGGGTKIGGSTSAYAPLTNCNKKAER